jgi:hypothetical protein
MLRIAVPYGLMNSKQLRKVAEVSTAYDRGYAHVSTRQNILHIGQLSCYEYSYHWFEWHAFVQLQVQPKCLAHLQVHSSVEYIPPRICILAT